MAEISIEQLINKTLIARKKINVYKAGYDSAIAYGYVAAGQPVGVVYSWLDPAPSAGRSGVWIMFYDDLYNTYYYTPWDASAFDVDALRRAGVLTVDEQKKQEAEAQARANMQWWEIALKDYGMPIALTAVALFAAPGIIKSFSKKQ